MEKQWIMIADSITASCTYNRAPNVNTCGDTFIAKVVSSNALQTISRCV